MHEYKYNVYAGGHGCSHRTLVEVGIASQEAKFGKRRPACGHGASTGVSFFVFGLELTLVMPTHCGTQRTQPLQPVSPWISLSAILVLAGPSIDSEAVGWQQECQSAVGQLDRATIALTFFLDQLRPPINLREKCVSYISQQSRTPLGPISALGNLGLLGS